MIYTPCGVIEMRKPIEYTVKICYNKRKSILGCKTMPFLIFLALIITIFFIVRNVIQKKYFNFVLQNSICLKKLQEINRKYKFFNHIDFNQSHTYDNENFYWDITCLDYLIYQLQFISTKVIDQINKEKQNNILYKEYQKEVVALTETGKFLIDIGKLKYDKLVATEKRLINQNIYAKPHTNFYINVTLYCSQINGRIYDKKNEIYYADDILALIKRLRNRNGTFYNDREIWNSICRVERGKVSNKMRFSIYQRDGYRCRKCGVSQMYAKLEVDHIIPIAKGGKSTYNNLQTLCHRCNVEKGDNFYY